MPKTWKVADKTGTCDYGTTNDIAIIWTNKHTPVIVAIYFTKSKKSAAAREDVIALATRLIWLNMDKAASPSI